MFFFGEQNLRSMTMQRRDTVEEEKEKNQIAKDTYPVDT
jgi:hypothetical protein